MLTPTPFHARTAPLVETGEWRDWSGSLGAGSFQASLDLEYWSVRHGAGLLDASPLRKYDVSGPGAEAMLDRLVTRDIRRLAVGRVAYTTWCDDDGKVIDDGTITRLAEDRFRLTAAEPSLRWLEDVGHGLEVTVRDDSSAIAALALQGPRARDILAAVVNGLDPTRLGYFEHAVASLAGKPVELTRTGYTGDLGYELWLDPADALPVWDALVETGRPRGLAPIGLAALDVVRLEAGYVLAEVDYTPARHALTAAQPSSPDELGLGWTVAMGKSRCFVGQRAIAAERARAPRWRLVGLEVEWPELERLYAVHDLAPRVAGRVARDRTPVFDADGAQVGYATSRVFSPMLKRYVALAHVDAVLATPGTALRLELPVETGRGRASARVVRRPFLDLDRRRH